jgi:hypothetical protein
MALSQQVHTFALQRLTWPQSGAATFVIDDRGDKSDMQDFVAELLWKFRHLAEAEGSSSPTSKLSNLEAASANTAAGASTTLNPSAN